MDDVVVQKYGGTSVADAAALFNVARRVVRTYDEGHPVCAVVSARGDTTDQLLRMAREISPDPPRRELDMLLSAGERISCSLLAMAIHRLGRTVVSFTGSQAGILTDEEHGRASILEVRVERVRRALDEGRIALVAGFQGMSRNADVTTLGRGGSDTSAVALAHALDAGVCEIYTDVDGVHTANPSVVADAHRIPELTYAEMIELAAAGAEVLAPRCVALAARERIPVRVRSSFSDAPGTWLRASSAESRALPLVGVTYSRGEVTFRLRGLSDDDRQRLAADLTASDEVSDLCVEMPARAKRPDTLVFAQADDALTLEQRLTAFLHTSSAQTDDLETLSDLSRVSAVGTKVSSDPLGVIGTMEATLRGMLRSPVWIASSRLRASCLVPRDAAERAVTELHAACGLRHAGRS